MKPKTTDLCLQQRLASQLSESIIFFHDENSQLVAVNGYVVDYSLFCMMTLWYLRESQSYSRIASDSHTIDRLRILNPDNTTVNKNNHYRIIQTVYKTFLITIESSYSREALVEYYLNSLNSDSQIQLTG